LRSFSVLETSPVFGQDPEILHANDEVTAGNTLEAIASVTFLTYPQPAQPFEMHSELRLSNDLILDEDDFLISSVETYKDGTYLPTTFLLDESFFTVDRTEIPASTPPGQYYLIAKTDVYNTVVESDETNNEVLLPITIVAPPAGNEIDLELSMFQSVDQTDQWSSYSVDLEVKNEGSLPATGIAVSFKKPDGVVYVGANQFDVSQGDFEVYGDEKWNVGNLNPGEQATLRVYYFQQVTQTPIAYAQVISANENDADSTPNNGTPPTTNEDDEVNSNGGDPINSLTLVCNDDVSVEEPFINSNAPCSNFTAIQLPVAVNDQLNCGIAMVEYVDFNLIEGNINVNNSTGFCNGLLVTGFGIVDLTFRATDDCGNIKTCVQRVQRIQLEVSTNFVDCINYTVEAEPGASGAIVYYNEPQIEFTGCPAGVTPDVGLFNGLASGSEFPIGSSTVAYKAYGCYSAEAVCAFEVTVEPASTNNDKIDLELQMDQSVTQADQWSSYSVETRIRNEGNTDATGISILLKKPDGVVYVGNNEFTISQGFLEVVSQEIWDVGTLSAGEEAVATVNYFQLIEDTPVAYAQVISVNEEDMDSTPNNGTPPTPNEDDEANSLDSGSAFCEVESDFPWHEWFSQINLNYEVFWPSDKSAYSDFTESAPIASLERGSDENYVFDITYSYFTFDAYIRYYVDFNQNGIFEESEGGSVTKTAIAPGSNVTAVRGSTHNIPIEAKLGQTRARFIISRSPINSACENVPFGEIEDYTVEIVDELPNTRLSFNPENYFKMYPNPVIDALTIDVDDLPGVKNISIYNTLGHLVISRDLNQDQYNNKIQINTSELMDGSYVVHLTGDGFRPRVQVIIVQQLK